MGSVSLEVVKGQMERASRAAGRPPVTVRLVVVSKGRSPEQILELYRQGQRDFGENRAQELAAKVGLLPPDIRWHFVGPLQTNKVRLVRGSIVLLHSLDRLELGKAWVKGPGRPPKVLLQVNVGREAQKHGVGSEDAISAARELSNMGLELAGLMTMPPLLPDPELARPFFRQLRQIGEQVREVSPQAVELSMGMSDDFMVAIEEGATIIRVGRAIFEPGFI
jgi:hypothetical protein